MDDRSTTRRQRASRAACGADRFGLVAAALSGGQALPHRTNGCDAAGRGASRAPIRRRRRADLHRWHAADPAAGIDLAATGSAAHPRRCAAAAGAARTSRGIHAPASRRPVEPLARRGGARVIAKAIEGLLFRWLFIPLARHAPWASRRLRPLFASITWRLLPNRRRTLRETARVLLGSRPSPREIDSHGRRVLLHLQDFIADVATIDRRPIEALASRVKRFDGLDHLLAALRSGRGAILASAHLGSFESAVAALRRASSVPVHVLFARDRIRAFDRARTLARRHLGVVEHPV
ncbi:MAG: hypothetical protein FJ253_11800, partial [Phycisphaerae bacterium]|nr:hypothetical protein [Phycisphaerae bacterium]